MSVTDVSVRNPVFACMLMACTMLFGIVAVTRIGISQFPDVDYPNISVAVQWPGAAPAAVEREVVEPLEQAISQVEGIRQISSSARPGSARVTATFLMTTIAVMIAAIPPLLGLGPGTETRSPMAAAVLGGLTVSTVLSLLVVPAFYVVSDRVKARIFGRTGAPERTPTSS